jgi:hypothetical protein
MAAPRSLPLQGIAWSGPAAPGELKIFLCPPGFTGQRLTQSIQECSYAFEAVLATVMFMLPLKGRYQAETSRMEETFHMMPLGPASVGAVCVGAAGLFWCCAVCCRPLTVEFLGRLLL